MRILHFCPESDWRAALDGGSYTADTLASQGFIHCSTPEQAHLPANFLRRGQTGLVLLEIDEDRLPEPPRYEPGDPADPASMLFPHVYGPIPVAAVVAVHDFPPGPDGTFTVPPGVGAAASPDGAADHSAAGHGAAGLGAAGHGAVDRGAVGHGAAHDGAADHGAGRA